MSAPADLALSARKVLGRMPARPAVERVLSHVVPLRGRHFSAGGTEHPYFVHPYNPTWRSERAVEIPLALEFRSRMRGQGAEIGNVLAHYVETDHIRVDKYEQAEGVQNLDVLDFDPGPLDWIIAISTLEHVGWDEEPRDPAKAVRALEHLRGLLVPGGRLFLTVPLGHNPGLDAAVGAGIRGTLRDTKLVRGRGNTWTEVDELPAARYDHARHTARALWVAELSA
jgi:hypothetical protein